MFKLKSGTKIDIAKHTAHDCEKNLGVHGRLAPNSRRFDQTVTVTLTLWSKQQY